MKTIIATLCALFLVGMTACNDGSKTKSPADKDSSNTANKDNTSEAKDEPVDSATMMKNWMEYMTPGDMHKMLASFNGTWEGETKMWMSPDAPPTVTKGTAVNTMIMGGRYQQSRHTGNFDGMPFEGISILGYDNNKKKFVNTWIDNMGTGIMIMEGTWDEGSKTMTFEGEMDDPMTRKNTKMRQTVKIIDDNTQLMEMYCKTGKEKEYKNMEIKMTRKK